jgi:hypothetical protein
MAALRRACLSRDTWLSLGSTSIFLGKQRLFFSTAATT